MLFWQTAWGLAFVNVWILFLELRLKLVSEQNRRRGIDAIKGREHNIYVVDIAPTVGPLTHGYSTDSRFAPNHYSKIGMRGWRRCVAVTMGARHNLYQTYYLDPNHDTNPNAHPHFGIWFGPNHPCTIKLTSYLISFDTFSGVSHIKLTMPLLLKQM